LKEGISPVELETIRRGLLSATGFDIGHYKSGQMLRLLSTIMSRAGVKDFQDYLTLLKKDPQKVEDFKHYITINVSEFFRDKTLFDYLDHVVILQLVERFKLLKIWSAGCASGEEPYSLAVLLEEKLKQKKSFDYEILASDIDAEALNRGITGIFPEKELKNVSPELKKMYFDKKQNDYRVQDKLKRKITFLNHDLLLPMESRKFHLILCRNVVIYFREAAKNQLYSNLWQSLEPGGVLFTGGTENLLNYRNFGFEKLETYFYRKPISK
jgi:chemotaxis protein methyltransferase CheR